VTTVFESYISLAMDIKTSVADWVVVLDSDPLSQEQLQVCRAVHPPEVKGAIRCDDEENSNNPLCSEIDYFPAFCHVNENSCVYGVRRTLDEFAQLATLVQPNPEDPSPRTTSQAPNQQPTNPTA